jgi:hypothetical protein
VAQCAAALAIGRAAVLGAAKLRTIAFTAA